MDVNQISRMEDAAASRLKYSNDGDEFRLCEDNCMYTSPMDDGIIGKETKSNLLLIIVSVKERESEGERER